MAAENITDLKPVYLIYGAEGLLLERAVRRLRERVAQVADLDYNFSAFDGESADADEVIAAANTLPFMSEKRLVIVRNVDKMPTSGLGMLADYAANPAEHTALVLVAVKLARNTRLFKAIDARKGTFEYKAPKRGEYPAEVVAMFKEKGKAVTADGAELLVRAVGRDLRRLATEVEKIAAFIGEARALDRDDIEAVVSKTASASVFDFVDALGARDCRLALRELADLLGQGESVLGVQAMAVRHVRTLLGARSLLDRGVRGLAVGRELGLGDWQAKKAVQQAARFQAEELVDALRGAAASELSMKTSQADARLVFERWVVSICGRA